jgi:hypothetical protein
VTDELAQSPADATNSLLWQYADALARLAEVWAELPDGSEPEELLREAMRAVAARVTQTALIYTFNVDGAEQDD